MCAHMYVYKYIQCSMPTVIVKRVVCATHSRYGMDMNSTMHMRLNVECCVMKTYAFAQPNVTHHQQTGVHVLMHVVVIGHIQFDRHVHAMRVIPQL